jgi:hypothetical protein
MGKVYVFKVALKYRKGLWRRVEIKGDQTLGDFDGAIRAAFNHDTWDHLSEFFRPGGGGSGAGKQIDELGLSEGDKLEYVYDFGDEIQHTLMLEKVVEREEGAEYPRVVARSKPRYHYCVICKKEGKKTIAMWVCIECSEKEGRDVFLCEDCLMREHEEIVY